MYQQATRWTPLRFDTACLVVCECRPSTGRIWSRTASAGPGMLRSSLHLRGSRRSELHIDADEHRCEQVV